MRFDGHVALITGSGKGIGKATALRFASEGASIVLNDTREDLLDQGQKDVEAAGSKALAVKADVSDGKQVRGMVDQTIKEFGKIDVLVNNVGVDFGSYKIDADEKDWDRLMDIDLKSQLLCAQSVVPHMVKAGGGKIVNVSSMAGRRSFPVASHAYSMAKAGVISFTRQLAWEVAEKSIRVNCVVPGNIATEEGLKDWDTVYPQEVKDLMMAGTPMKRLGRSEEVAAVIAWLASDDSSYVTGVFLAVDGGMETT